MTMELKFEGNIIQNGNMDAGYVIVPYDIKEVFGKGRILVHATFDGYPYDGQVVRMGTPNYIIGIKKDIRKKIGKTFGDKVEVTIRQRSFQRWLKNIQSRLKELQGFQVIENQKLKYTMKLWLES